jgi:hypothetical protein
MSKPTTEEEVVVVVENLVLHDITFPTPKPSIFSSIADVELVDSSNASTTNIQEEKDETTQNNENAAMVEEESITTADEYGYESTVNNHRSRHIGGKSGRSRLSKSSKSHRRKYFRW